MNKETRETKTDSNKPWRPEPEVVMGAGSRQHVVDDGNGREVDLPGQKNRQPGVSQVADEGEEVSVLGNENGAMGYILAWLFGVPASILFVIFLLRGH